jgi:hypothetical protein
MLGGRGTQNDCEIPEGAADIHPSPGLSQVNMEDDSFISI